jgi:hypothetical protein
VAAADDGLRVDRLARRRRLDQVEDVVDHVLVRDKVEEARKRA